jgi:hypothetical protein
LQEDAAMREPLPAGIDPADKDAALHHVDRVVDDLVAALDRLRSDPAARARTAEKLGRRYADVTRPAPVDPLRTVSFMNSLDNHSCVRWRQGLIARTRCDERQIHLVLHDKTISFPIEASASIIQLQTRKPCRLEDFAGLDSDSAVVVARRLLREGVLVPVP